ncbi:hypothetical protein HYW87_02970 [Candidatus Roizmanbacteria bacterium]|nr:hypothetical protein [Candidatus Roizmanbacteria bacterium]
MEDPIKPEDKKLKTASLGSDPFERLVELLLLLLRFFLESYQIIIVILGVTFLVILLFLIGFFKALGF